MELNKELQPFEMLLPDISIRINKHFKIYKSLFLSNFYLNILAPLNYNYNKYNENDMLAMMLEYYDKKAKSMHLRLIATNDSNIILVQTFYPELFTTFSWLKIYNPNTEKFEKFYNDNCLYIPSWYKIYATEFSTCRGISKLIVEEGITRIPYIAFCFCENLKEAFLPLSITDLGPDVFRSCDADFKIYSKNPYVEKWAEFYEIPVYK